MRSSPDRIKPNVQSDCQARRKGGLQLQGNEWSFSKISGIERFLFHSSGWPFLHGVHNKMVSWNGERDRSPDKGTEAVIVHEVHRGWKRILSDLQFRPLPRYCKRRCPVRSKSLFLSFCKCILTVQYIYFDLQTCPAKRTFSESVFQMLTQWFASQLHKKCRRWISITLFGS